MSHTPEQLRDWANQIGMNDYNYASPKKADIEEQLRAHADKIEECELLKADAERYRWLRHLNGTPEGFDDESGFSVWDDLLERDCIDERFDAEVDAARKS